MADDAVLSAITGALEGFSGAYLPFQQAKVQDSLLRQRKQEDRVAELEQYKQKLPLIQAEKQNESDMNLNREKSLALYRSGLDDQRVPVTDIDAYNAAKAHKPLPPHSFVVGDPTVKNAGKDEKTNQFWEKEWGKFTKDNDPTSATSRTTIGILGKANLQAKRAKTTLSNPMITNAEAGNVMADLAGIYAGGAPTDLGMKHQSYDTLYGKAQQALQYLSGNPKNVLPLEIKQRLLKTIDDMQSVNTDILRTHNRTIEKTRKNLISHYPDEWKSFRSSLEGTEPATDSAEKDPLGLGL